MDQRPQVRQVPEGLLVTRLPDRDALLLVRPHGETAAGSAAAGAELVWLDTVVVEVVRMIGWDSAGQMAMGRLTRYRTDWNWAIGPAVLIPDWMGLKANIGLLDA